jgi:hypothetical protein
MDSLRASSLAIVAFAALVLGACDDGGAGARDANVILDGGGGGCGDAGCAAGLTCCGGACVNQVNDPRNCGLCGYRCPGPSAFCSGGVCAQAPCNPGNVCATPSAALCCGAACCKTGELCCEVNRGGPSRGPECVAPIAGTCPVGCPLCK